MNHKNVGNQGRKQNRMPGTFWGGLKPHLDQETKIKVRLGYVPLSWNLFHASVIISPSYYHKWGSVLRGFSLFIFLFPGRGGGWNLSETAGAISLFLSSVSHFLMFWFVKLFRLFLCIFLKKWIQNKCHLDNRVSPQSFLTISHNSLWRRHRKYSPLQEKRQGNFTAWDRREKVIGNFDNLQACFPLCDAI